MKTRNGVILLTTIGLFAFTIVAATRTISDTAGPPPLAEKVKGADAIVVGTVAEIDTKCYTLTLNKKGSDSGPMLTQNFDLAVLHPTKILKSDEESIVNKANDKNPDAWMHMAFQVSTGRGFEFDRDFGRSSASKGDHRIWFLRHDVILTGHYFIWDIEPVTEDQTKKIEDLVKAQQSKR